MTVGHELCRLTGYRLFHNHLTIEPFLEVFEFGSPSFVRLSSEFRRRVVEEAIASDLPGLVFTFVWGLELEEDRDFVQAYVDLVEGAGGRVSFVELAAPLAIRQERNNTEFRLAEKKSKRDRAFNDANLVEFESYVMNTGAPTPADVPAGRPSTSATRQQRPARGRSRTAGDCVAGPAACVFGATFDSP